MEKIFPTIILVMQFGAMVMYAAKGDWKRAAYWVGACIIVGTVTY